VRPATPRDLSAVLDVDHIKERAAELRADVLQGRCLVAARGSEVLGFCVDGRLFAFAFLELLVVDPRYRRQGVGTALVKAWEASATTETLTTMPDGYIDHATQFDPCTVLDLTIGSYHPEKFKAKKYKIAIVANRNTNNHTGSRYQLRAEQLDRECDFSPFCVGIGGFSSRMLLVSDSKGFAPGCRDWWRNKPSEPC